MSTRPLRTLVVLTALACSTETATPTDPGSLPSASASPGASGNLIIPMCQLGCMEQDPDPSAPGYWLGSGIDDAVCFNGSQTDSDADGLSEFCERNLASSFAPQLRYWQWDDIGRETKWVAQKRNDGSVRVGYLLSYYRDHGSSTFGCTLPGAPSSCYGHNGDSEAIFLDVAFDEDSRHWVLKQVFLSTHGSLDQYDAVDCTIHQFQTGCEYLVYPDKYLGYPRVFVSEGKHANYATKAGCNDGGFGGADTCTQVNASVRVSAGSAATNLGSRSVHSSSQDCMVSSSPSYIYHGSGRTECYWTVRGFRGWVPDSVGGAGADDYSSILADMGFGSN